MYKQFREAKDKMIQQFNEVADKLGEQLLQNEMELQRKREELSKQQEFLDQRQRELTMLLERTEERNQRVKHEEAQVLLWLAHAKEVVPLNVGGEDMSTTRTTLTKVPGSMLAAMFSGRHPVTRGRSTALPESLTLLPDAKGSHFIDRDPSVFKYLLNFLRTDKLEIPTVDGGVLKDLVMNFDYFCVPFPKTTEKSLKKITFPFGDHNIFFHPQLNKMIEIIPKEENNKKIWDACKIWDLDSQTFLKIDVSQYSITDSLHPHVNDEHFVVPYRGTLYWKLDFWDLKLGVRTHQIDTDIGVIFPLKNFTIFKNLASFTSGSDSVVVDLKTGTGVEITGQSTFFDENKILCFKTCSIYDFLQEKSYKTKLQSIKVGVTPLIFAKGIWYYFHNDDMKQNCYEKAVVWDQGPGTTHISKNYVVQATKGYATVFKLGSPPKVLGTIEISDSASISLCGDYLFISRTEAIPLQQLQLHCT